MNSRYRDRIISVSLSFLLLVVAEIAARVWYRHNNTLDEIASVISQDPDLIWVHRPHLRTRFQNATLRTNSMGLREDPLFPKKQGCVRIVCLGGSSTFGWGVEHDQAYPAVLESLLRSGGVFSGGVEVINGGIIGYTSLQGLRLLQKEILGLSPDILVVSYMVNDLDKLRFYRNNGLPDKELRRGNAFMILCENAIERSVFYRVFKRWLLRISGVTPHYYGTAQNNYPEIRRVSDADYRENLLQFISVARQHGIHVILLKLPMLDRSNEREIWGKDNSARDAFIRAQAYRAEHNRELSEAYYKEAKQLELLECLTVIERYYRVMDEVSVTEDTPLADAVRAFRGYSKDQGPLFLHPEYDLVHPSVLGHKIIAQELFQAISDYQSGLARKDIGG